MTPETPLLDSVARTVLDAFPEPVFLLGEDMYVFDVNNAARRLCGEDREVTGRSLCGAVLRCAHALEQEGGCGRTEYCPACVIRQGVFSASRSEPVVRRWTEMERLAEGGRKKVCFLVSVSALALEGAPKMLVVLQDVTDIVELRSLLPICSHCGKVRSGVNYWHTVQDYLRKNTGVQFSHGLCPDCIRELYGEEGKRIAEQIEATDA